MPQGITLGRGQSGRRQREPGETAGYRWADLPGDIAQAFGQAGRAGLEGYATALSGVDDEGRTVGSILPMARDERTGEAGLAAPRILDLWNTLGGVAGKGVTLGSGPVFRKSAEDLPDRIARMLKEGRAAEVTDDMLGALGPNDQRRLYELYESGATGMDLPMDEASRMARAREMGFGAPAYHGTADNVGAFRGETWTTGDPSVASDYSARAGVRNIPEEKLEGATNHYGDPYIDEFGDTRLPDVDEMPVAEMNMLNRQYGEGQNVAPLRTRDGNILDMTELGDAPDMEDLADFLNARRVIDDDAVMDAKYWIDEIGLPSDEFGGAPEPTLWKAIEDLALADDIKGAGYTGLKIDDVAAGGSYGHPATLLFDPANIRSRHARFDPRLKHNADLLASRAAPAGIGLGDPNRRRLSWREIEDKL
jgi:hypothetical protein